MRFSKSLLCGISALAFATGTAFAGLESSVENSSPELLSGPELMTSESLEDSDRQYFAESETDVIYLIPLEVTEYYLVIPSQSSEMPG
jgi:hypothetical protein